MDKLDKLKKVLEIASRDTISATEIKDFLVTTLNVINKAKNDFEQLSSENIQYIKDTIEYVNNKYSETMSSVDYKNVSLKNELSKKIREIESKLIELDVPPEELDKEELLTDFLTKVPTVILDDRAKIVEKINTGTKDDTKIELQQISGVDKLQENISNWALGVLDQRTQFLINKQNTAVSTGGEHTIQDEGTPLTQRTNLNFVGAGVTVTDGGTGPDSTIVTISAGSGDMVLASAQTNSGVKTFLDTTMKLRNVANTFDGYFVNTNTADRIYTLQDRAGTLADDTDLALKAPLASPTFTGTVTLPKTLEIQDTSANHQYVLAVSELTADRTVTLPLLGGADEFVFKDHPVTLTNKTLTSPTITTASLSGTQLLAESASIGFDPAGSADGAWSGITITGTSGYTQAFGDLVTLDKDDSRWEAVDISVAAAATGDARGIMGMVVVTGTDGNACTILLHGTIRADANFPALTIGAAVYASTTGDIVVTQPVTVDHVIRLVGYALTADSIYFNPENDWITRIT